MIQEVFSLIKTDQISPAEYARMKDEYSDEEYLQEQTQKARKEGKEEGREKGNTEGQQQKALEIARSLLAEGLEPAIVAKTTGLSPDELATLSPK
ncbi:hypothetical protein BGP_6465 [Beggiatoa sp. PS]|nr:hypothetical protein BGP_6465 [Beggiatoa sp. PS]